MLLKLQQLETLSLDMVAADDALGGLLLPWLRHNRMTPARMLKLTSVRNGSPVERACRGQPAPTDADKRAYIRVVGTVLYSHNIQYEYTRSSDVSGRLAADISQVATSAAARPLVPAAGGAATAQPTADTPTSAGAAIAAGNARLLAAGNGLAAASPSAPGVRATLGVGTYGNAALNEAFTRPMAVGFNTIHTYAIRDALITIAGDAHGADQQLIQAREFCAEMFPPPGQTGPGGPSSDKDHLSPVEQIICDNTGVVARREAEEGRPTLVVPPRCGKGGGPPGLSQPLHSVTRLPRDKLASPML